MAREHGFHSACSMLLRNTPAFWAEIKLTWHCYDDKSDVYENSELWWFDKLCVLKWTWCGSEGSYDHWCRRRGYRGCKRTPKSFDFVKIRAKFFKILAKSVKFWAKWFLFVRYLIECWLLFQDSKWNFATALSIVIIVNFSVTATWALY